MEPMAKDGALERAERKPWVRPTFDHLASSEAEFGAGATIDAEGFS